METVFVKSKSKNVIMETVFVRSQCKNVIMKMMFFIPPTEYVSARNTDLRSSTAHLSTRTSIVMLRSKFSKSGCSFNNQKTRS